MGRAHDPGIGLAGQIEIVGVFAFAAHQRVIFLAADRLPDAEFLQCDSVFKIIRLHLFLKMLLQFKNSASGSRSAATNTTRWCMGNATTLTVFIYLDMNVH